MTQEKKQLSPAAKRLIAYLIYTAVCVGACFGAGAVQQAMRQQVAMTFKALPYAFVSFGAYVILGILWAGEAILAALTAEAEEKVQGVFWNVKKKREEYVEENLDAAYDREYAAWLGRKDAFETQQAAWADEQNALIREEYSRRLEQLRRGVGADEAYVEDQIAEWIGSIDLPMEFDLEYEYDAAAGVLMVNLDLPEIEEIPDEETVTLASGATKLKAKSQKAIKEEYARCVMGLGVFCASHFFCITPDMERILMSAYTQRRDKKSGDMQDEYIYSVIFERKAFEREGYEKQEPDTFFNKFKNRMLRLASGDLKKIDPYTAEDL